MTPEILPLENIIRSITCILSQQISELSDIRYNYVRTHCSQLLKLLHPIEETYVGSWTQYWVIIMLDCNLHLFSLAALHAFLVIVLHTISLYCHWNVTAWNFSVNKIINETDSYHFKVAQICIFSFLSIVSLVQGGNKNITWMFHYFPFLNLNQIYFF